MRKISYENIQNKKVVNKNEAVDIYFTFARALSSSLFPYSVWNLKLKWPSVNLPYAISI